MKPNGYITLRDILDVVSGYDGLKVEINLDGDNTAYPSRSFNITGSYIGILKTTNEKECTCEELTDAISRLESIDRQAFVRDPWGDIYVVTSVDHIEFDEFNLIEIYAESLA